MIKDDITIINKWKELKLFFKTRTCKPLDHPEFLLYFSLVVILFGSIGVWFSWYLESQKDIFNHAILIGNIATYSLAIIATAAMEFFFIDKEVLKKPLSIISSALIFISIFIFLLLVALERSHNWYWLAIPYMIFSLYIWWVANGENKNLTSNYYEEQSETTKQLVKSLEDYES